VNNPQVGIVHPRRVPGGHRLPRVLITGVQCAGKTSIAFGISQSIPDVEICEFGQIMARIGEHQNLISDYRDLPGLRQADRARLQTAAAESIAKLNQPVAIAAHVIVQAPEGYVEGLPESALSYLRLSGIIVTTSDPQEIRDRRLARMSTLKNEDIDLIKSHQERVRQRASEIAQAREIPIGYIDNATGHLSDAINTAVYLWQDFIVASL
jgi:adenylate kinase